MHISSISDTHYMAILKKNWYGFDIYFPKAYFHDAVHDLCDWRLSLTNGLLSAYETVSDHVFAKLSSSTLASFNLLWMLRQSRIQMFWYLST